MIPQRDNGHDHTLDLREALKDMSPEDRAIQQREFEESVQAGKSCSTKIMVEITKRLVNAATRNIIP
jgi:hypothetical protein